MKLYKYVEVHDENAQAFAAKHGTRRQSPVPGYWDCGPIHGTSDPILGIMRRTTDRRSSARAYKIAGHRPVSSMIA